LLGVEPVWPEAATGGTAARAAVSEDEAAVQRLLAEHPETGKALAALVGGKS